MTCKKTLYHNAGAIENYTIWVMDYDYSIYLWITLLTFAYFVTLESSVNVAECKRIPMITNYERERVKSWVPV